VYVNQRQVVIAEDASVAVDAVGEVSKRHIVHLALFRFKVVSVSRCEEEGRTTLKDARDILNCSNRVLGTEMEDDAPCDRSIENSIGEWAGLNNASNSKRVPRYAADGTFEGYVGGCLDIHSQKEAAEKVRIADEAVRLMKIQDEERRRIARELHDSAGQTLTVLGLSLAQLVEKTEGIAPELVKDGKEIEEIVQQLHREIRTTSYLLHPPLLDECGLASALNWYVEGLARRSGIAIKLDIAEDIGRLPNDMELAVFRLVQECLTNINRHSGSKTADIRVFVRGGTFVLRSQIKGEG